jgi:hypothetical protein
VAPQFTRTTAVNSASTVFVYLGTKVPRFQPYMLPTFPWRLELAHGYSHIDQPAL